MSYHTVKYGARFLKGSHGLWLTLGALGIGYIMGKKVKSKGKQIKMIPIIGARTRKCFKDIQQGWYGIVDEAKGNIGKKELNFVPNPEKNEVKVNRREISGYSTETISRGR